MSSLRRPHLVFALLLALAAPALAQVRDVGQLYATLCASCHGLELQGGSGPSLVDSTWLHGDGDAEIAHSIRTGYPAAGMPGFGAVVSDSELRTLILFMRERAQNYQRRRPTLAQPDEAAVLRGEAHAFRVETVVDGLDTPWSMAWLPDGRMLVTEKPGNLRVVERGRLLKEPVRGTPQVNSNSQGGLLEVALHPDYARNGWIYLAFSHPTTNARGESVSMTKLIRGRLRDGAWVDEESIWEAPLETYRPAGGVHYGCRIAFDQAGYLYFSHGERGVMQHAQDLTRPNGKIHRIHDDGRIPADNPFVDVAGAIPSIWTYGNRNPQGLDFDPRTGLLWETEHGPRGGDELNVIQKGANYGWPVVTFGMNYDGTAITGQTAKEGITPPILHWTPSIAVCGIDFYEGDRFPGWKHNLFVTALAQQELRRVVIDGGKVIHQEVLLKDIGRLRDVASGPDGYLYIAVNQPGKIIRVVPAPSPEDS